MGGHRRQAAHVQRSRGTSSTLTPARVRQVTAVWRSVCGMTVFPSAVAWSGAPTVANGSRRVIACARHAAFGLLVGFTELFWNPKRAPIVWQQNTEVVEAHRNRGLGPWLRR